MADTREKNKNFDHHTKRTIRNQIANPYYWATERQQFTQLRCLNFKSESELKL